MVTFLAFIDDIKKAVQGKKPKTADWLTILLPILIEALQALLANCTSPERFADSCNKVPLTFKIRGRLLLLGKLWLSHESYGLTLGDCMKASREMFDELVDKAQAIAGTADGQQQLATMFKELKEAEAEAQAA